MGCCAVLQPILEWVSYHNNNNNIWHRWWSASSTHAPSLQAVNCPPRSPLLLIIFNYFILIIFNNLSRSPLLLISSKLLIAPPPFQESPSTTFPSRGARCCTERSRTCSGGCSTRFGCRPRTDSTTAWRPWSSTAPRRPPLLGPPPTSHTGTNSSTPVMSFNTRQ